MDLVVKLAGELSAARTRASRRRDSGVTSTSHGGPTIDAEEHAAAESFARVFRPEDFLRKADVEDDIGELLCSAVEDAAEVIAYSQNVSCSEKEWLIHLVSAAPFALSRDDGSAKRVAPPRVRVSACRVVSIFARAASEKAAAVSMLVSAGVLRSIISAMADSDDDVAGAAASATLAIAIGSEAGLANVIALRGGETGNGASESTNNGKVVSTDAAAALDFDASDASVGLFLLLTRDRRVSSIVRLRCLEVAAKIAMQTTHGANALVGAGFVPSFVAELSRSDDVLAVLGTLELCGDLLSAQGMCDARALAVPILECIIKLASVSADAGGVSRDLSIVARAMSVLARCVARSSFDDKHMVVAVLSSGLDPRMTESLAEEEGVQLAEASASAFGELGLAECADVVDMAMTTTVVAGRLSFIALAGFGSVESQMGAMHSLAAMIGADRPGSAILSDDAELKLRQAVLAATAVASPNSSVAQLLLGRLQRSDPEKRIAMYRFLAPMCSRQWFVVLVCEDEEFVQRICDVDSESGLSMQNFRHSVVLSTKASLDAIFETTHSTANDDNTMAMENGHASVPVTTPASEPTITARLDRARQLIIAAARNGPLGHGRGSEAAAPVVAMDVG